MLAIVHYILFSQLFQLSFTFFNYHHYFILFSHYQLRSFMSDNQTPAQSAATSPVSITPAQVTPQSQRQKFTRPLSPISPLLDPAKIEPFLVDLFHALNEVQCADMVFDMRDEAKFPYYPILRADPHTPDFALTSFIINLLGPELKEAVEAQRTPVTIMQTLPMVCQQRAPQGSSVAKMIEQLKFSGWQDLAPHRY